MTLLGIISESEREHVSVCRVGEQRFARLNDREAAACEKRLDGRTLPGWSATVVRQGKRAQLRYTKT